MYTTCKRIIAGPNKYLLLFQKKMFSVGNIWNMNGGTLEQDIRKIFLDSVSSVNPSVLISSALKIDENLNVLKIQDKAWDLKPNIQLVGFGKAVFNMATECVNILGKYLKSGIICVPEGHYGNDLPEYIQIFKGAKNNLPDENSEFAAREIEKRVKSLNEDDLLLVLISGGGSALLPLPVNDISLYDKVNTIKILNSVGADIREINTVRKRLSLLKGGGLAEIAYPCNVISLILSDIIDDPLDFIASGPTVLSVDSQSAAFEVIQKYRLDFKLPRHVIQALRKEIPKTRLSITKGNYSHVENFIIGNNKLVLSHAKRSAEELGYGCILLSNVIEGLVSNLSIFYAKLCLEVCKMLTSGNVSDINTLLNNLQKVCSLGFNLDHNLRSTFFNEFSKFNERKRFCFIGGGETTVKIYGPGKGGRNQELALLFSKNIYELSVSHKEILDQFNIIFLSAGTDGIDGPTDVAGALGSSDVILKAEEIGLSLDSYLAQSDTYNFFLKLNKNLLVKTGPTGTNVMDIHILLIEWKGE